MAEPSNPNFAERLTNVERKLDDEALRLRLQMDATQMEARDAREMAAAADRDVSEMRIELRGHTQVLNALRQTQLDHHDEFVEFRDEMRDFKVEMRDFKVEMRDFKVETRANFAKVDDNFVKVERAFATVHTGMAHITTLLEGIADRESGTAAE